ncbi:folylpolyglutamate synthase [[Emmonsia] crescens]|uniref:Folylpolyglutamate synthase n=1 Tax=[Emmonsia] crescens TaxID=73230 RepID=A0A0G2HZJ6_9EURO|nr:folylpolyglutamate synthase [Emmonsia crescens UAMH 3008]
MKRSYKNALKLLEMRRRHGRPTAPAAPPTSRDTAMPKSNKLLRGVPSLAGMSEWLRVLGHSDRDLDKLNIVHIAGTKGKGSTCAFTRSFLHVHGLRTGFPNRIGLYTSPHLKCIRERIQIDNQPLTEDKFTRYFFEVWESLISVDIARLPRYLQLLALLAFHTFIKEKVDAAIFETHHGGEYDATNVIPKPVVTGITSLGMDHISQLGPTIEDIAWHKAGIFKAGTPAFSASQEVRPSAVLSKRAAEKGVNLTFISTNDALPDSDGVLSIPVQRLNCSLALEIVRAFLKLKVPEHTIDLDDISSGIENFSWAGRFEVIEDGTSRWFLDGAHNMMSLEQAAKWFSNNTHGLGTKTRRVLIFSHFSEDRDGSDLVECLAHSLLKHNVSPDYVIFTTYQESEGGSTRIGKSKLSHSIKLPETYFPKFCDLYSSLWKELNPRAVVSTEPTIEGAIQHARRISAQQGGMEVLVTGSLYLAGGALNFLRPQN